MIGEPHRLASELDLVMILAAVELVRRLWNWQPPCPVARVARALAVVVVLARRGRATTSATPGTCIQRESDYRQRVEYRMSDWMASHLPQARTMVAGSVRFWWDAWHDLAQVGGGSEQGLLNSHVMAANGKSCWDPPELAVRWLTALGADAVIVSTSSRRDLPRLPVPAKFAGVLPVLYDDHRGNVIYQVPRRYPSLARVVDRARLDALQPLQQSDLDLLRAYNAVIEEGPDSPTTRPGTEPTPCACMRAWRRDSRFWCR